MASDDSQSESRHQQEVVNKHLGARIRSRRKKLSLSQTQLGRALDLTFQQVQKYENGSNRISAAMLYKMGAALGVHINYFFEGLAEQDEVVRVGSFAEAQDPLHPGQDGSGHRNEFFELIQVFSRIPDPDVRERILALLQAMSPKKD